MGTWGVKVTESDYGLDLLAVVQKQYLQEINYKHFNIKDIKELLKNHIIEGIRKANKGARKKEMDFYIEETFPYRYDHAVMLIAELLADYFNNGKIVIDIYETGKNRPTKKNITDIVFTPDDLKNLLTELQVILNPKCEMYISWEESKSFDEWRSYMEMLCESLKNQITNYIGELYMGLHLVGKQFCNMCGKELDTFDKEENFGFHYTVGYGSKYDLNKIDLNLCCDCFDKLMDYILPMCKLNPIKEYKLRSYYEKHEPKS